MSKLVIFIVTLSFVSLFVLPHESHGQECLVTSQLSADRLGQAIVEDCCAKSAPKAQMRCVSKASKRISRLRTSLSGSFVRTVRQVANQALREQCSFTSANDLSCGQEDSFTVDEILNNIAQKSCNKDLQYERERALKKTRRSWISVRKLVGSEIVAEVGSQIRSLLRSESCGAGGADITASCSRIVDPRDGYKVGNVYKLSDHGGRPVFLSHNGARQGEAITVSGQLIERLSYTGLANPDSLGDRHHYRMTKSCGSLPTVFLLRIGAVCYEINDRCGRID
ncbi:MAG: hypothetical protein KDD70_06145 [Bdellovibrionales bacterium]|nr:hypothetical protein [Bdellovibrionales bacterium]